MKRTTKNVAKVLPNSSGEKNCFANDELRLIGINNASDVDGEVLMISNCYKDVFEKRKKNTNDSNKRLSIVKITANGKSIHRSYKCVSAAGFISDYVALSPNSIMLLNDKNGIEPKEAELCEGSWFPFYWYHPDKAVRLSFKLGLISLLMGFMSIVISIIGLM